jgi:hypothetical protein
VAESCPALAWRLTSTWASPRGVCDRSKGVHTSGRQCGSSGRATSRRGLAVVWPEKDRPMTRARALKQQIRSRAARTGERYTTARRHVLKSLEPRTVVGRPESVHDLPSGTAKSAEVPIVPKTGISDKRFAEKTGHGLDYWFTVLDRFGAVEKGHTAAARHLFEAHGVDGWYAQGITVAYERARGVRGVNQRCDGSYEVSVSKVLAGGTASVVKWLKDARRRRQLEGVDRALIQAFGEAVESPASKGFVIRPDGQGSFRYKWKDTMVQFLLLPKANGKVSLVVTNTKLASSAMVEERRAQWRAMLGALAAQLAA